jgi:hypothetical protein
MLDDDLNYLKRLLIIGPTEKFIVGWNYPGSN